MLMGFSLWWKALTTFKVGAAVAVLGSGEIYVELEEVKAEGMGQSETRNEGERSRPTGSLPADNGEQWMDTKRKNWPFSGPTGRDHVRGKSQYIYSKH
jgi:hypothetical protein